MLEAIKSHNQNLKSFDFYSMSLLFYKLPAQKIKSEHRTAKNRTEEPSNRDSRSVTVCTSRSQKGEMEMKTIAEEKSSPRRRELRLLRSGRNQKHVTSSILEAISHFGGGEVAAAADGRMKIVVRKEDVKQVLEAIRDGRGWGRRDAAAPPALSLEQRLNFMRRRQILRAANRSRRSWRPVLQSIPEEI